MPGAADLFHKMTLPLAHLGVLGLGLGSAIVFDLRSRRIPNLLSALIFLTAIPIRAIDLGGWSALSGVGAAVLVIAVLYLPWQMNGIGGGDVKLWAATAAWVPWGRMLWFVLAAALVGGLVAAPYYFKAGAEARADIRANLTLTVLQGELPPVPSHRAGHPSVPYALAIAAGAVVAFFVGV